MCEEYKYKVVELTDEEAANVSGGAFGNTEGFAGRAYSCPKCWHITNYEASKYREYCENCHYDASKPLVPPEPEPEMPEQITQIERYENQYIGSGQDLMKRYRNQ